MGTRASQSSTPSEAMPDILRPLVKAHRHGVQEPVSFRPATWRPRLEPHGAEAVLTLGVEGLTADERLLSRPDLADLRDEVGTEPEGLRVLFAAVMIWGSGKSNGRGPRHTEAALADGRLCDTLADTCTLVRQGDLRSAYRRFRVHGVGRSFFTKWFAFVDDGSAAQRALILDDRVLRTLNNLGWSSREAAGTAVRSVRYATYVSAMHTWAEALHVEPAWLEWLMFLLSNDKQTRNLA
jgi:hypothetical protein